MPTTTRRGRRPARVRRAQHAARPVLLGRRVLRVVPEAEPIVRRGRGRHGRERRGGKLGAERRRRGERCRRRCFGRIARGGGGRGRRRRVGRRARVGRGRYGADGGVGTRRSVARRRGTQRLGLLPGRRGVCLALPSASEDHVQRRRLEAHVEHGREVERAARRRGDHRRGRGQGGRRRPGRGRGHGDAAVPGRRGRDGDVARRRGQRLRGAQGRHGALREEGGQRRTLAPRQFRIRARERRPVRVRHRGGQGHEMAGVPHGDGRRGRAFGGGEGDGWADAVY